MKRALCGLKQLPCAWCDKVCAYSIAHGFGNSPIERNFYVRRDADILLVIVLHVDDMFPIGPMRNIFLILSLKSI